MILLGRHSIEAAVAMLGCMHRGVVIAPLPPMFNESQLSALIAQTRATGLLGFGGEKELAKCERVADQVPLFLAIEPDLVDRLAEEDPPDEHVAASRRRPRDGAPLLRDDLDARRASRTRATRCATRPRASASAGS